MVGVHRARPLLELHRADVRAVEADRSASVLRHRAVVADKRLHLGLAEVAAARPDEPSAEAFGTGDTQCRAGYSDMDGPYEAGSDAQLLADGYAS